jgi:ABC-type glutathione transport system ATPase component
MTHSPILELDRVQVALRRRTGWLWSRVEETRLLDDLSLAVAPGEFVYLIGARGAGKTVLARTLAQLIQPTGGAIRFMGRPITNLRGAQLRQLRQQMQVLFQNPYSSLNPRLTAEEIVAEPLRIHGLANGAARPERARQLLRQTGVNGYVGGRRPFELSGGLRQRVSLARALACEPRLLVLDDPAAMLDAAVGEQMLRLIDKLRRDNGLTCLLLAAVPPPDWLPVDRVVQLANGRISDS